MRTDSTPVSSLGRGGGFLSTEFKTKARASFARCAFTFRFPRWLLAALSLLSLLLSLSARCSFFLSPFERRSSLLSCIDLCRDAYSLFLVTSNHTLRFRRIRDERSVWCLETSGIVYKTRSEGSILCSLHVIYFQFFSFFFFFFLLFGVD